MKVVNCLFLKGLPTFLHLTHILLYICANFCVKSQTSASQRPTAALIFLCFAVKPLHQTLNERVHLNSDTFHRTVVLDSPAHPQTKEAP